MSVPAELIETIEAESCPKMMGLNGKVDWWAIRMDRLLPILEAHFAEREILIEAIRKKFHDSQDRCSFNRKLANGKKIRAVDMDDLIPMTRQLFEELGEPTFERRREIAAKIKELLDKP